MIETVVKAPLPVGEALVIQKNRIAGADPKSHRRWPGCWKKRKTGCKAQWIFILR